MKVLAALAIGISVLAGSGMSQATRSGSQPIIPAAPARAVQPWVERLEGLKPSNPQGYFELAEEIADIAVDREQRELARHLFGLAGALDRDHLGRSACLALADFEEDAIAKRRLLALAALLGSSLESHGGAGGSSLLGSSAAQPTSAAVLAVGESLSHYRKGKGAQAQAALKRPGATELFTQYDRMVPGGLTRFLEDLKLYRGQSKPSLSSGDVSRMLRFEAALLSGTDRTWSGELLLSGGQPLIEVDPERLEEALGVDPTKPYFRKGRWAER